MYYQTFLGKDELFQRIAKAFEPAIVNRIISAYELAETAYSNHYRADSMPVFYHITRVCKIVIDELAIIDPDLIIASLLHDVFISKTDLNHNIISFNFGYYVTFLIDALTDDAIEFKNSNYDGKNLLEVAGEDGFIIRLSEILDEIRCIEYNNEILPIPYYTKVIKYYLHNFNNINNEKIEYLIEQIKKEGNRLLQ